MCKSVVFDAGGWLLLLAVELAEQCYEAARGAEPTLVPVWEAMAATAAQSGSSAGSASAAAAADHAIGLGGGPESWLGYTTGEMTGYLNMQPAQYDSLGVRHCMLHCKLTT